MVREDNDINFFELFKSIRKRWVIILEIILVCIILSVVYSFIIAKPVYQTTTKLFIGKQASDETSSYDSNEVSMFQKLMSTYAGFAESTDLIERAIDKAKLDVTAEQVSDRMTVIAGSEDQFLTLTYRSNNIDEGVEVLKAVTDEFVKTSTEYIPNGNIEIVESPRVPTEPSSPNKARNIAVAFIFGLIVSVVVAMVLEFLDNTVKKEEDIENLLGVPVIGIVPEADSTEISNPTHEHKRKKSLFRRGGKNA